MKTIQIPYIETLRHWSSDDVRSMCCRNDLYTMGTIEEYCLMLKMVDLAAGGPTTKNMYLIAKDICEHSEDQTITNIMYMLEREAVYVCFEIDGQDDI